MHHYDNTSFHSLRSGRTYTRNPSSRLRPSITVSTSFSTPSSQTEVQKQTSGAPIANSTSIPSRSTAERPSGCSKPAEALGGTWVFSLLSEFPPQNGPCGRLSWCTRKCGQCAEILQVIWVDGEIWKIGGWILEFLFRWIKLAYLSWQRGSQWWWKRDDK